MTRLTIVVCLLFGSTLPATAQIRRMEQDPNLNNLKHASDYQTCVLGALGKVEKVGSGNRDMVLIAGAGFGGEIFKNIVEPRKDEYTMYLVTLPGFDGTAAPPMPKPNTSYGEQTWTHAAVDGVRKLIDNKKLDRPVVVVHWYLATQIGIRLALDEPDLVSRLIVISGVPKSPFPGSSLKQIIQQVDTQMAPKWFKTVTRDTWDDNNFLPGDYAQHPVRALQLWRQAAAAPMPVWIRYLCEAWAQDITLELDQLKVPTLIIKPDFDEDHWYPSGQNYMKTACIDNWNGDFNSNDAITTKTIQNTRVFIMDDQPDELNKTIAEFLSKQIDK